MGPFLKKFFPSVYRKSTRPTLRENNYCKFDSQLLQLFTSSLYIAALIASFFAATVTRKFGRKISMVSGGVIFLAGAVLNGAAVNIEMLIIGRILLGVGVGFANQVHSTSLVSSMHLGMLSNRRKRFANLIPVVISVVCTSLPV